MFNMADIDTFVEIAEPGDKVAPSVDRFTHALFIRLYSNERVLRSQLVKAIRFAYKQTRLRHLIDVVSSGDLRHPAANAWQNTLRSLSVSMLLFFALPSSARTSSW